MIRGVPHPSVLTSWRAAGDVAPLCAERRTDLVEGAVWGYRPGSLVQDPVDGTVYLITSDGDRGLPQKRGITGSAFACYGWQFSNVIAGYSPALSLHPSGSLITSCTSAPGLPRAFVNGTLVKAPSGTIYFIDGGKKRGIATWQSYLTWFGDTEFVSASDLELSLINEGLIWGFRQGKLIQPAGSEAIYIITDDAGQRAQGSRRGFTTWNSLNERGYSAFAINVGVSGGLLSHHGESAFLLDADEIP